VDENITKAEIKAMVDVQIKSTEHLAIVAKSLQDISAREDKIYSKLSNGLGKDIVEGVGKIVKDCEAHRSTDILEMKKVALEIKTDVGFLKWIYGGLFALIGLAWLIIQIVNSVISQGAH